MAAGGALALHVLDAMFATSESMESGAFVPIDSTFEAVPALVSSEMLVV